MLVLKSSLGGKFRCSKVASDACDVGVLGVGGRRKICRRLRCLTEVVRERLLQHLESARSLTFHPDASKHRLMLLCQFCGADLQPRHGLLGTQSLGDDSSAAGLAIVILRILRDLCAPLSGAPIDKSAKYRN